MKKNFIILMGVFVFFACDEYLDKVPDNRQTVTSLPGVSELLVSAYSEGTYNFVDALTDNVAPIVGNTQINWMTENYRFKDVISGSITSQDTPDYLWSENYFAIAHSNQALEALSTIVDSDEVFANALRGEALITRAYNHFILATTFCLHYNDANKSSFGIPYITAPETQLVVNYERGTLEDTYAAIEKDLLEALPLLSDDYLAGTGKYHFNTKAAYAFASRFFLFKGDYEKCITYSNKLLGSGVLSSNNHYRNMQQVFTGTSSTSIANQFIDITLPSNLLVVRKSGAGVTRYNRGYPADVNVFSSVFSGSIQGGTDYRNLRYSYGTGASALPKYTELFEYTTSTTGFPYFIMPELRSEEVILNRMEAYIYEDRYQDALNDYNAFAPSRYSNGGQLTLASVVAYFGGTEKEAMLQFVVSERRKEMFREGLRMNDVKRYNMEIKHIDVLGEEFVLTANDLRKAVQIPPSATSNGIQANPR